MTSALHVWPAGSARPPVGDVPDHGRRFAPVLPVRSLLAEQATLDWLREAIGSASRLVFEDLHAHLAAAAARRGDCEALQAPALRHALRHLGWRRAPGGMQQHLSISLWEKEL